MAMQQAQPRWVPDLTFIEYFILLTILNKPLAGIEIFEELVRETGGRLVLSPGTLYAALKRMLTQDLILMVDVAPGRVLEGDSRRKFYSATARGQAKLVEMGAWMRRELVVLDEELERPGAPPPALAAPPTPSAATKRRGRRFGNAKMQKLAELMPA